MDIELKSEIERLIINSGAKRRMMLYTAHKIQFRKKILTVASGILALLSAAAITTVIIKLFGNTALQIVAAMSALFSGIISIVLSTFYSDRDVSDMFEGSAKYLSIRERATHLLRNPNIADSKRYNLLTALSKEYSELDGPYSKFNIKPFQSMSSINDRFDLKWSVCGYAWDDEVKAFNKEFNSNIDLRNNFLDKTN